MNTVLWVLQVALAFVYFAGGAYKVFNYDELAKVPAAAALPHVAWATLGVIEMLGAVLLIVPAATKRMPELTPIAAGVLAVESLGLALLYARYSLEIAITNPLVFAAVMALLVAFVSYGRFAIRRDA